MVSKKAGIYKMTAQAYICFKLNLEHKNKPIKTYST
jgi:hypothetical protein